MPLTRPHNLVLPPGHTAKSSSAWTSDDLQFCNVNIIDVDAPTFFGKCDLPTPNVSSAVLKTKASTPQPPNHLPSEPALTDEERLFFQYLQAAMVEGEDQQAAMIDFTIHLLFLLGYTQPHIASEPAKGRRAFRRDDHLPLFMCGRNVHAPVDLSLVSDNEAQPGGAINLLVKAGSYPTSVKGHATLAEAQLMAQAIAAFQCRNRDRRRARLAPIETQVVPAIVMNGTSPSLYKIEVTAGMVECVQTAQVPPKVTSMLRLQIPFPRSEVAHVEGMIPLDNRKITLSYLEAFKAFV